MQQLLDQIETANIKLMKFAKLEDWESIVSESKLRHRLIEDFFSQDKTNFLAEEIQHLAAIVSKTDTKITTAMKQFKVESIQSGLDLKKVQTALNNYKTTRNTPHTG